MPINGALIAPALSHPGVNAWARENLTMKLGHHPFFHRLLPRLRALAYSWRRDCMKRRLISRLVFSTLICLSLVPRVIAEHLPVRIYTSADGLGSGFVDNVMRDSCGFMWLCTRDRLSRFAGSSCRRHEMSATQGLRVYDYALTIAIRAEIRECGSDSAAPG
jgi:hypothetical protein